MSSGPTAQQDPWKSREQAAEANYARSKEREQLAAIRADLASSAASSELKSTPEEPAAKDTDPDPKKGTGAAALVDRDFEGGFGGQEDLEDRYATTLGEH